MKKDNQKGGYCSPHVVYNETCFTLSALKNIASKLNDDSRYSHTPNINVGKFNKKNKSELVDAIQYKLNCKDDVDFCILNKKNDFYKEIRTFFKPLTPGNKKWLNTINIKDVMEQYMLKYEDFMFYGPVPLDFYNFYSELANVNIKSLTKNKKRVGIVFNLDYSYQPGSHWVSLFIDFKNKTICFFDSVGTKPPKEILKLMKDIHKSAKKVGINMKLIVNQKQHQFENTECGVYSIYFIVKRLEGNTCEVIFNNVIDDKKMNKYREKFFRK